MSRLENAIVKACFFITGARGPISANERAQDDECHLTIAGEEVQPMTGPE